MGCGASKDVKELSSSGVGNASWDGIDSAIMTEDVSEDQVSEIMTEVLRELPRGNAAKETKPRRKQRDPTTSIRLSRTLDQDMLQYMNNGEGEKLRSISRMDQDMLLYMNQGENLRFSCWDFGGQDTFYSLHHLYMGRNSVFVLLFNMEWFLPDPERDGPKK